MAPKLGVLPVAEPVINAMGGKWLEILKEAAPGITRTAAGDVDLALGHRVIWSPRLTGSARRCAPRYKRRLLMLSIQSIYGIAFCTIGALVLIVAYYQAQRFQIGKVPLVSLRAKHVIGIFCIIIGALILIAKLILRS
jgi:hypothetical protein